MLDLAEGLREAVKQTTNLPINYAQNPIITDGVYTGANMESSSSHDTNICHSLDVAL